MKMDEKIVLAQELARIFSQIKRHGWHPGSMDKIKKSEFFLLSVLISMNESNPMGVKVSDISTHLQITPAAVTQMINSLEASKYVERLPDPDDRRVVLVRPTEEGKQMILEKRKKFLSNFEGLVEYLGEEDSQELIRLLSMSVEFFKVKKDSQGE